MSAARLRVRLDIRPEAETDLSELQEASQDAVKAALLEILRQPRAGDSKAGRLHGAWSWRFAATPDDDKEEGRIVYRIKEGMIIIFAIHADHDEAYKRARKRAAKYL